jgi:16S rRNA processing protein RimM
VGDQVEVLVGKVGRAHGIRGDLMIDVRTDEPDRRFAPGTVFATRRGPLTVASLRWHSGRLLVTFAEVADRSVAETLRGTELRVAIDVDERPEDPEEFYDHQLVGLRAVSDKGDVLGEVAEVLHLPGQDVLVVRRSDTGTEAMVPFVTAFVPDVDLESGRLLVTDTVGLLDTDDAEDAVETDPPAHAEDNDRARTGTETS